MSGLNMKCKGHRCLLIATGFICFIVIIEDLLTILSNEKQQTFGVSIRDDESRTQLNVFTEMPTEYLQDFEEKMQISTESSKHVCDNENGLNKYKGSEWTIMLTINSGYFDFFLNWFTTFKMLRLELPIVVIAEDISAFELLNKLCIPGITTILSKFKPINETVSFASESFNDLSVRRHTYILQYLEAGKKVIFSDTDTVWVRNPLPYFIGNYDMWMQIDAPAVYCPGTMAILSNSKTIGYFRRLTRELDLYPQADQPYMNRLFRKSNVRVRGLRLQKFPAGRVYFDRFNPRQRSNAVVVHNNWIIGHDKKMNRFKVNGLWKLKHVADYVDLKRLGDASFVFS